MKTMKKALSFFICVLMLFNTVLIASAVDNVDVILEWSEDFNGEWKDTTNAQPFSATGFEPGSEIIRYFKIENIGSLAFSYELSFICEGVLGELAEVIDVYTKSDVTENVTVSDMENIGTLNDVVNVKPLFEGDRFYNDTAYVAVALKMKDNADIKYMGATIGDGFKVSLIASQCDYNYPAVDKFDIKFPNTKTYLYRVGNMNTVTLGSLFKALDGAEIANAKIDVVALNDSNVTYTYTANADWTKGTIKFEGTGPVTVTISDDSISAPANPVSLNLEVVDAKNATTATSATANNVVLLNDISGTFTVSNGHTFYGNGFEVKLPTSSVENTGNGFSGYISIGAAQDDGVANGGNLDNVRIIGPVYPEVYFYRNQAEITDSSDPDYGDGNNMRYFKNSVIIYGGDCTITNSYISGSRAALYVKGGNNTLIENTTLSGGSFANLEIAAGNTVTLKDITTVQKEVENSYGVTDSSGAIKKMLGTGIAVSKESVKVIIEGEFNQYNWLNKAQWDAAVPSLYSSFFPKFFTASEFEKYRHYKESDDTTPYVNSGLIFMCNWNSGANLTDNRSPKTPPYEKTNVTLGGQAGGVYSIANAGTLTDELYNAPQYSSEKQNAVAPIYKFDYTTLNNYPSDGVSNEYCYYDTTSKKYMISFDEGGSRTWDGKILTLTKGTRNLDYTMSVSGGLTVNQDNTITFDTAGDYTVTYTYTDEWNYQLNNGEIEKYPVTYTKTVDVTVYEVEAEAVPTKFDFLDKGYRTEVTTNGDVYAMPDVTATVNSNTAGIRSTTIDGVTVYYPVVSMHKSGSSSWYNYFSVFEGVTITDCDQTTVYNTSTTTMPSSLEVIGGFILNASGAVSTAESKNGTGIFNYSTGKEIKCKTYSSYGLCYYPDSSFSSSTNSRDEQTIVAKYRYTDSSGKQYYYYIGYWCEKHTKQNGCVTGDTLVTLADGTEKRMDEVEVTDKLLVWDFYNGGYAEVNPAIIFDHGYTDNTVIKLKFEDETEIKVVNAHQFFDLSENKFVNITADTVESFVGHEFVKLDGGEYKAVKLSDYEVYDDYVGAYGIISSEHYNIIVEGMLTTDFEEQDFGIFNYFEIGNNLTFDKEKMEADISEYGLYTYEDFENYLTPELFDAFNVKYMKVAVGKGQYTYEGILGLIDKWIVNSDETEVVSPITPEEIPEEVVEPEDEPSDVPVFYSDDEGEPVALEVITTDSVVSGLNTITTATYSVSVEPTNATETDGAYVCQTDEAVFKLTASGAKTGYAIITVDGDTYYTGSIADGQSVSVTVKNAKGQTVTISSSWGVSPETAIENNLIDLGEIFVESTQATADGAKAVIANTTKYPSQSANIYIAVYNTDTNMLVALNGVTTVIEAKDECEISVTAELPVNYEIKVFVWDDALTSLIK